MVDSPMKNGTGNHPKRQGASVARFLLLAKLNIEGGSQLTVAGVREVLDRGRAVIGPKIKGRLIIGSGA